MADILDEAEDKGELEIVEEQIKETEEKPEKQDKALSEDPTYRGKAIEDVIRMHQEAKKVIDRQASEVGEVRKLADELIKSQLYTKPKETEKPVEVDYFEDPQKAIDSRIAMHPDVLAARENSLNAQKAAAKQRFNQLHPDSEQIIGDPDFVTWVRSSPARQRLLMEANNYDVDAGDHLLSTYKELKGVRVRQLSEADKSVRDKTLKSASIDTGGSGESSKKVYKRSALIQLRLRDPQAFAARKEEIERAYAEGRVR